MAAWSASRLRRLLPDALGLLAAVLYGLPSLWYAYGRDQAIFHYIGREWLAGRLPYRDVFDTKPPAIYLLYGLLNAPFAGHTAPIRVAELIAVLAMGALAVAAVRRDSPRRPGELGLLALLSASVYYSLFDYWDGGQVELWEGLCMLAAYVASERAANRERGAFVAGLLAGLSFAFKFTALVSSLVLAVLIAVRVYQAAEPTLRVRQSVRAIVAYGAGQLLLVGAFVAYFTLNGAFASLVELIVYLRQYTTFWNPDDPLSLVLGFWKGALPWALAFLLAWLFARFRARARQSSEVATGATIAMLLLLAALGSVAVQRKFFVYHWGVAAPFMVLIAAYGVAEGARLSRLWTSAAVCLLVFVGFWFSPAWASNPNHSYRTYVTGPFWQHVVRHKQGPWKFSRVFVGMTDYSWRQHLRIANAIRTRMRPGDMLHVRGFELGMYVLTGLHSPVRFVSEVLLDDAELESEDDPRSAQQQALLWKTLPRFFVTFDDRPEDVSKLRARGYVQVKRAGAFLLFERSVERPHS